MRRLVLAVLVITAVAIVVALSTLPRLVGLYENVMLDSRETRVPCSRRPPIAEARRVLAKHHDRVRQIEAVYGDVFVELEERACPGRGTLVVYYGTHQARTQVERLIGGDSFFGVPYSLRNV